MKNISNLKIRSHNYESINKKRMNIYFVFLFSMLFQNFFSATYFFSAKNEIIAYYLNKNYTKDKEIYLHYQFEQFTIVKSIYYDTYYEC